MRHAKSDWSVEGQSDHDRSLNDRGRRDAPAMARWLAGEGLRPDVILCSTAARTCQTAGLLNATWTRKVPIVHCPSLYLADPPTIFDTIASDDWQEAAGKLGAASPSKVLVLGHNPGISDAASRLWGGSVLLPTAALMAWQSDNRDWSRRWTRHGSVLVSQMRPKLLDAPEIDD